MLRLWVVFFFHNLLAVQETWVQPPGWEDPLEEEMATHSSILAWRIPMDRGAWQAAVHGVAKSWTQPSDFHSLTHVLGVFSMKLIMSHFLGYAKNKVIFLS